MLSAFTVGKIPFGFLDAGHGHKNLKRLDRDSVGLKHTQVNGLNTSCNLRCAIPAIFFLECLNRNRQTVKVTDFKCVIPLTLTQLQEALLGQLLHPLVP